jgi:hypothetical protein
MSSWCCLCVIAVGASTKGFGLPAKASNTKVILNGGQRVTFARPDGYFSLYPKKDDYTSFRLYFEISDEGKSTCYTDTYLAIIYVFSWFVVTKLCFQRDVQCKNIVY